MTTTTTAVNHVLEQFLVDNQHSLGHKELSIYASGQKFGKEDMQISLLQATLLQMLIKMSGAERVLEIGTYVGFSASVFAAALPNSGEVVTCEISPDYQSFAQQNITSHGLQPRITSLLGDAKDLLSQSEIRAKKFDFIFLDGDKENYHCYFDFALHRLSAGGLFVIDNTLFKGEILAPESNYAQGISALLQKIRKHPNFDLSHVTIGDGMLVARHR